MKALDHVYFRGTARIPSYALRFILYGTLAFPALSAIAQQAPPTHDHGQMQMKPPSTSHDDGEMSMSHDHGDMPMSHDGDTSPSMPSAFGPYSMMRDGSGTSWQPDTSPMEGLHWMRGDWSLMLHGFANVIYDRQTGPRGDRKSFTESMAMLMAQRPLGPGTLGLRAMVSLDPTIGKSGYPLLFQTGETADGRTPLVDRQHPHDAFMELSASYSTPIGNDSAVYVYGGLPGEPALGPPAFMHRFSGMRNPEAPITHHWLDSTHITFGVVTLGASKGPWKIEASSFNGREPDQNRWNIETRKFDSWSTRVSFNPAPEWSAQISYGDLKSPEALEPDTRVKRTTASVSYSTTLRGNDWQTTLAWGRNDKRSSEGQMKLPGWLLESTYVVNKKHAFFGRFEQVKNDELFQPGAPLHGQAFQVRKLSVGYIYDFIRSGPVSWGLGGLVGFYEAPAALDPYYGSHPRSYMVFLQGRL